MTTYPPEALGRPCPECGVRVVKALGQGYHPTCGPEDRAIMAAAPIPPEGMVSP